MEFREVKLPKEQETVNVYGFADTHAGSPSTNREAIKAQVDKVAADESAIAILNGDIGDWVFRDSVGDIYAVDMTPQQQKEWAVETFKPIKDKIVSIVDGNHERRATKLTGMSPLQDVAKELDCHYSSAGVLLKLTFGQCGKNRNPQCVSLYHIHGKSASRTVGGKFESLRQLRQIVFAHVYITAHTHVLGGFKLDYIMPDLIHNKLQPVTQGFVNLSHWMDYGGYAEIGQYEPGTKGSPVVVLRQDSKEPTIVL